MPQTYDRPGFGGYRLTNSYGHSLRDPRGLAAWRERGYPPVSPLADMVARTAACCLTPPIFWPAIWLAPR